MMKPYPGRSAARDLHPEDATCEVWSGDDAHTAQFLGDCLRGVGIACAPKSCRAKEAKAQRALVLPDAETRAREIVHEVVEGAPPRIGSQPWRIASAYCEPFAFIALQPRRQENPSANRDRVFQKRNHEVRNSQRLHRPHPRSVTAKRADE